MTTEYKKRAPTPNYLLQIEKKATETPMAKVVVTAARNSSSPLHRQPSVLASVPEPAGSTAVVSTQAVPSSQNYLNLNN